MDRSKTTVPFKAPRNFLTNQLRSLVPPKNTAFYT